MFFILCSSTTANNKAQKRPAWDLKGRLEDIETLLASKNQDLATVSQQVSVTQFTFLTKSYRNHVYASFSCLLNYRWFLFFKYFY